MVEFRWIIFSLFLMLLFNFTVATGDYSPHAVRVGDEVILSCESVKLDQDKCDNMTWFFRDFKNTVTLIDRGQIHKDNKTKSDRLSVTENCSLVIKKVTVEDAGFYTCRQIKSDAPVFLFVVTMTEQKDDDKVTLNCSVMPHGLCDHTVKWLYEGKHVDEDSKDMETSESHCSVTVTFLTSYLKQKSEYHELFKCELTDFFTKEVQQFNFSRQSSGDDATPTKSPTTMKSISTTGNKWTSVKLSPSEGEDETPPSTITSPSSTTGNTWTSVRMSPSEVWWRIIIVSVGLSALLISVVTVNIWTRTKGDKTQEDENMEPI